jgi:hypothetical protein
VGEPTTSSHCRKKWALARVAMKTIVSDRREGAVERRKKGEREMLGLFVKVKTRRRK